MNTFKGYRLVFERDQFDSKLRSYYLHDGFRIHDKLDCFRSPQNAFLHHLTSHQIYTSHLLILSSSLKLLSRSYIFLSVAFYLLEYSRSWYCVRMSPKVISSSVCLNCVFPLKLMYLIENQFYVSPNFTHMIVFFYFVFLF